MPTYEYRCPEGHEFEKFTQKMSDAQSELSCPTCGKVAPRRMSAGGGLVFKGSGFYITDYGKDGKKDQRAAASAESAKGEAAKAPAADAGAGSTTGAGDSGASSAGSAATSPGTGASGSGAAAGGTGRSVKPKGTTAPAAPAAKSDKSSKRSGPSK